MGVQLGRRSSKRPAESFREARASRCPAAPCARRCPDADKSTTFADYEHDNDFTFVRGPRRTRTEGKPLKLAAQIASETQRMAASVASTAGIGKSTRTKPGVNAPEELQPQPRASESPTCQTELLSTESHAEVARNREKAAVVGSPPHATSTKIALATSYTPIINRNNNMRKKGNRNRRTSLGSRGRRASSLVEGGEMAIPHPEVDAAEFYKHIAADLVEPRRMKQLLMWCAERALSAKPPHGTTNADAIMGGVLDYTCRRGVMNLY